MSPMRQRTARAVLWSAVEIGARYCTQAVVTLVLARLLTPNDFGLIALLVVFTSIAGLLTDAGFGNALIQRRNVTADDETTVFVFNAGVGLLMALLVWIGAKSIASYFSQQELTALARLAALGIPIAALGTVPDALLTKRLDFISRTNAQLIASLGSGSLAIFLAWRGFGPWSLVWQGLVASTLRSGSLWFFSQWRPSGKFRVTSFRTLFGFGGYLLMSNLLYAIAGRLQSVAIAKLFDARLLGYYTLAQSVPDAPVSFMGALLSRLGLPVFSTLSDRPEKLRDALRVSLRLSMFLFIPCMFGLALVARPLVTTLYGEQWAPAVLAVSLLSIAASIYPLHVLNLAALNAQGRSDRSFKLEVFKNLSLVVLTLLAAPFGPNAIAGVMIVSSILSAFINTWYTHKTLDFGLASQLLDQRETFLLAFLASIPAWCVLHWSNVGVVPTLVAIALAIFVYLFGAIIMRHPALGELLGVLRNLLAKQSRQPGDQND